MCGERCGSQEGGSVGNDREFSKSGRFVFTERAHETMGSSRVCPEYGRTAFRRAIFATRRSTACLCFVYFCSERLCEFRETGLLPQETGEQSETFGESEDVLPTGRETIPVGRTRADVDKTYLWT